MMPLGTPFITPNNPCVYPAVTTTANCAQMEAEHKENVKKDLIQEAIVENNYLRELWQEYIA